MPYYKFRPLKQWGKYCTRIYRHRYNRTMREKRLPRDEVPQVLLVRIICCDVSTVRANTALYAGSERADLRSERCAFSEHIDHVAD